jgi:hypothetical protein
MPRAIELLREGRDDELWQMCCGFLSLSLGDFMDIQKRLLLEQLELLANSKLGEKIMRGARPRTVEEFRRTVPLTTYKDYCPELLDKNEAVLPVKPELWAHSSGRTGEYPCKWVPLPFEYAKTLSEILYGIGMISCSKHWGDTSRIPSHLKLLYSVARKPYISGIFADLLTKQTPMEYMPSLEDTDRLTFEERIETGFKLAMSEGLDYFFGLSLVLVKVGEKIRDASGKVDVRPYLAHPRALWRLARGKIKSRFAGRQMLPKDLWSVRGIIGSGIDSSVYKNKIKDLWGTSPLDIYSCTEGGVIATQTWDYDSMTFVPNLNFLEFIPEDEQLKLEMDRSYQPRTLLLDEVKAGENYEIIITNFYGGAMVRYRLGDMVKITALRNEKLGIGIPQMVFERRVDDLIDFNVIRVTEKLIWQSLEKSGIAYEDWFAYREPGQQTLRLFLEPKDSYQYDENATAATLCHLMTTAEDDFTSSSTHDDLMKMVGFDIEVRFLPRGTFARYTSRKQAEGADLAHLKPPHINPPEKVLSELTAGIEETIVVVKSRSKIPETKDTERIEIS